MDEEEVYNLIKKYLKENLIEGILSEDERKEFIKNIEARHTHENKKTLDGFYCENAEYVPPENDFPIGGGSVKSNRVEYNGNQIRYVGDGDVIESVEKTDSKITIYLAGVESPGGVSHIKDPIVIPLGGGVPAVHTLPTDAKDGDMCLYAPQNSLTLTDSGKRIYIDWEKFKEPSQTNDPNNTPVCQFNADEGGGFITIECAKGNLYDPFCSFSIMTESYSTGTIINFSCGIREGVLEYGVLEIGDEITTYNTIDELPKYFQIPQFNTIYNLDFYGDIHNEYFFHTEYRLMKYQGGEWIEAVEVPQKTSELVNDSGFITKADIPTDESYELIGQTPLTLSEASNIKLVANGETSYLIETPTVWEFDGTYDSSALCTLEKIDGYYKVTVDSKATAHYQSYIKMLITGLEIGETYTVSWDVSASNRIAGDSTTPSDWGGAIILYSGESTSSLIKSGLQLIYDPSYSFTATDTILQIRYYPAYSNALTANSIGIFNALYLNKGISTELKVPYKNNGTFTDAAIFKAIPEGATITTTPTADVYIKAPTDKTLSKSDVPADAKVTGERIEAVKKLLPLYGKTIVNFGDSIFGNAQAPNDISTFLAEKTGATVYNCGFGGCRMSVHPTSEYNAFSMYSLADSISSSDYTTQETALESTTVTLPERFTPSVERLKGIDFSKVDVVTIAYGTNDFNGYGVNLDNEENPLDTNTFGGALRYSIETLLTAYPNLKIFVLSIAYRFYVDENNEYIYDTNNHANNYGKYAMDYNAKLKEVAEEYNLPYVDDYNIGIGKFNRYQYFNVNDGAHHKEEGRRLIAEHLASALTIGQSHSDSYTIWKAINEIKGGIDEIEAMIDESGVLDE